MIARSFPVVVLLAAFAIGCAAESDQIDDEVACTLTLDYWRTHEGAWPVDSLTLGDQTYDQADLMPILRATSTADASVALGAELAAAALNEETGAVPSAEVAIVIADSHDFLADVADADGRLPFEVTEQTSEAAFLKAQALAGELRDFNLGVRGVLRCAP